MSALPPAKECPECALLMALDTNDFIFYCTDANCGYTEYCEDGKPAEQEAEEEDSEEFRCPHCQEIITEEQLPNGI